MKQKVVFLETYQGGDFALTVLFHGSVGKRL